jgi:hypothetical protein
MESSHPHKVDNGSHDNVITLPYASTVTLIIDPRSKLSPGTTLSFIFTDDSGNSRTIERNIEALVRGDEGLMGKCFVYLSEVKGRER